MAGVTDFESEVLQTTGVQVVGKEPVSVSRNPDDIPRVMDNRVTFHIDVSQMLGWKKLKGLDIPCAGIDIPYIAGIVVYPCIPFIVSGDVTVFNIQAGEPAQLSCNGIQDVTAGGGKHHPLMLQAEASGDNTCISEFG